MANETPHCRFKKPVCVSCTFFLFEIFFVFLMSNNDAIYVRENSLKDKIIFKKKLILNGEGRDGVPRGSDRISL